MRTHDFQNLVELVLIKAAENHQQEKADALRAVFVNTVLSSRPNYDEAIEMVSLMNQWQPRHLIMLKILTNPRKSDAAVGNVVGAGGGFSTSIGQILHKLLSEWANDQIERTWQDLYDARIHRTDGINVMITDRGIAQLEGRLTVFGAKVAAYLSQPMQ